MNETNPTNSIQQAVLDQVRAKTVRRRPRLYFILRVIAVAIVGLVLLATSALVISFILFSLHESGEEFLLGFGFEGMKVFLLLFPWMPALFAIALILLFEWLMKGFGFGYRIPLLNIFFGIVGVSIVGGILIALTPLHPFLLGNADKNKLPLVGPAYEHIFDRHEAQGVCRGTVLSVNGTNSFVIKHDDHDQDVDDQTYTVFVPAGRNLTFPRVGDRVLVFGHPEPGQIEAQNIQILPPR